MLFLLKKIRSPSLLRRGDLYKVHYASSFFSASSSSTRLLGVPGALTPLSLSSRQGRRRAKTRLPLKLDTSSFFSSLLSFLVPTFSPRGLRLSRASRGCRLLSVVAPIPKELRSCLAYRAPEPDCLLQFLLRLGPRNPSTSLCLSSSLLSAPRVFLLLRCFFRTSTRSLFSALSWRLHCATEHCVLSVSRFETGSSLLPTRFSTR